MPPRLPLDDRVPRPGVLADLRQPVDAGSRPRSTARRRCRRRPRPARGPAAAAPGAGRSGRRRRSWTAGSGELPLDHLERVAQPAVDPERGRRLVARVDHAVLAPGVLAVTVLLPGGLVQEVVERRVVDVGDQVARALPALDVPGRVAPGRARHLALALEELEVDRRGVELVLAEHRVGGAELGADVVAGHEDLLGVDRGVAVAGRDHEAVDVERGQVGEQLVELGHVGLLEHRGVGADEETGLLGGLDAVDRRVEDPLALDGDVVRLPHPVEVDVEEERCRTA